MKPGSKKRRSSLEGALNAVLEADPHSPEGAALWKQALSSEHQRVAVRTADFIRERHLEGFVPAVEARFRELVPQGVAGDQGCELKLKLIEALDFLEVMEPEVFLLALTVRQEEPAPAPLFRQDTAGPVRARALFALARLSHPELAILAGAALADSEAVVRTAAAEALAMYGVHHGAGALLLKLSRGDDEPLVTLACMNALLTLAPAIGRSRLVPAVRRGHRDEPDELEDDELKAPDDDGELAALALGQSGGAEGVAVLLEALGRAGTTKQRETLYRALSLSRSEAAAEALLTAVARGRAADAIAAVFALGTRRFEPTIRQRTIDAIHANTKVVLTRAFLDAFPEPGPLP